MDAPDIHGYVAIASSRRPRPRLSTTSFAALLAGVGIAIGAAWSGRLANLAAGVFRTFVGNAKILGDNTQNFTANPYRRVDLLAQLDNSVDHVEAIRLVRERLKRIPNRHEPLHSRGGRRGEISRASATRLRQRDEVVSAGGLSALGDRAMGALRSGCAHMSEP